MDENELRLRAQSCNLHSATFSKLSGERIRHFSGKHPRTLWDLIMHHFLGGQQRKPSHDLFLIMLTRLSK